MVCLEFTGLSQDTTVDTRPASLQEAGKKEETIEISMREGDKTKQPRHH